MKQVYKYIVVIATTLLISISSYSYDAYIDGIYYNVITKARIAKVTTGDYKYSGDIVIPNTISIDGIEHNVTEISSSAFKNCTGLTSVSISNYVTTIGQDAFANCTGLIYVSIPNSVTSIGQMAFDNCIGLTTVHISDLKAWCNINFSSYYSNPLYYACHLYLNGTEIKELTIPNSVTKIADYAFSFFVGFTSVTIPNSVTIIGQCAYWGCIYEA